MNYQQQPYRNRRCSRRNRYSIPVLIPTLVTIAFMAPAAGATEEAPIGTAGESSSLEAIQVQPVTTDPSVAAELPHIELNREQILALVGGVFENTLEGTAGPFDDLTVNEFLSNYAAVISAGESPEPSGLVLGESEASSSRPMLLESSIPLKHDGEVLDLGLERTDGAIESTNPLVPVGIPQELGDGIDLPDAEVAINVAGAATSRTPSILEGSTALYPNIAPNTDFAIAPAPTGVETFTVLRDRAAALGEQELDFDLPPGGEVIENGDGTVSVMAGGQTLVHISVPSATDAGGRLIPASMRVEGDSIYLSVDAGEGTSWPVLLDPLFETYQWEGTSLNSCEEFQYLGGPSIESNSPFSWICGTVVTGSTTKRGLATKAVPGTFHNGQYVQIAHEVPRYKQDQKAGISTGSFFAGMTLSNMNIGTSGGSASPFPLTGIWDVNTNGWAGLAPQQAAWGYPGNGAIVSNATLTMTSGNASGAKLAVPTSLMVNEGTATSTGAGRSFSVGTASFEIADIQNPEVLNPSGSSKWVNGSAQEPLEITVKDYGLGAKRANFSIPGQGMFQVNNSCSGAVASPCPPVWTAKVAANQYNPAQMPQGETMVKVVGEDAIGQQSPTAQALVLVDHQAPGLSLSGTLTEQSSVGTKLSSYTLGYAASDGDDAEAAAQTPFGTQGTGPGQLERPQGVAVDAEGNTWVTDRIRNKIVAYDKTGKLLREFGTAGSADGQISEPRSIAVGSNGNLWVAEWGNKRIQQFAPTGTFVSKITRSEFVEPWGVAVGSNGTVWVTDQGAKKVFQFKEDGSFIRSKETDKAPAKYGIPFGVEVDAFGNGWLAMQSTHKVLELSPTLEVIQSFGSEGTGPGQFRYPGDVAIADSGNIFVSDDLNGRVQEFKPDGSFLRQLGSVGAGLGQLSAPRGVDLAPGNQLVVADSDNHRVARWTHADKDPQSGVSKVSVKVDGKVEKEEAAAGCGYKNCALSGSWTLETENYSAGPHEVSVTATDGVGLPTTQTFSINLTPSPPGLALSGTLTEQATLGSTRPRYTLQAEASPFGQPESFATPSFISAFGATGSGTGQLNGPRGLTADGKGNVWVVDRANNRIEKFGEGGEYLGQFGSGGTGNGQFSNPWGIAVTPAGNIWVADTGNHRLQEFNSEGKFIQKFGTAAAGESKGTELVAPEAIAIAPNGMLWVADFEGDRVAEFRETVSSESERFVRNTSGATIDRPRGLAVDGPGNVWVTSLGTSPMQEFSSEGKFIRSVGSIGSADGQMNSPAGVGVDPTGRIYVVDQNNNRVDIFNGAGSYVGKFGATGTGNAQFTEPKGIAFGAGGAIFVTDKGNNRVHKWNQSTDPDQIASIEVKVDGKVVSTTLGSCLIAKCTVARASTINSNSKEPGSHTVEATAIDTTGHKTTKSLSFSIVRDTTPPAFAELGPLYTMPSGWTEQKKYPYEALATDENGYGVSSVQLKIDGTLVKSASGECPEGGCSKWLAPSETIDMSSYSGGSHPAELVATDGAGNVRKRMWTVNVSPSGEILPPEATNTLEAMEETVPGAQEFLPVAPTSEYLEPAIVEAGDNPHFQKQDGRFEATGIPIATTFDPTTETLKVEGTEGALELSPVLHSQTPEIASGAALVLPSKQVGANTVIRPEYNGAQMFTTICDASAPEQYEWRLKLHFTQYLVQANPQQIEVKWGNGETAFLISAEPAHDALGKELPTTLSIINATDIALKVPHREHGYTYPVSAGKSLETGYATVSVYIPGQEEEPADQMSPEEESDLASDLLDGFQNSNGPNPFSNQSKQRPRNKPVTRKQAKRILRPSKTALDVPAPEASASGGPGSCCEEPWKPVETKGRVYSNADDRVWDVEIQDGIFELTKRWAAVGTTDEPKCDDDVLWYWKLNLLIPNQSDVDNLGPGIVYRGEGKHLTYRCTFSVIIGPLPEEYVMENQNEIQLWVYPNGFQSSHIGENNWLLYEKLW